MSGHRNFIKTAEIFEEMSADEYLGISYTENDEICWNCEDYLDNFSENVELGSEIYQLNSSGHETRNNTENKESTVLLTSILSP